jgi:hypothetical protein
MVSFGVKSLRHGDFCPITVFTVSSRLGAPPYP